MSSDAQHATSACVATASCVSIQRWKLMTCGSLSTAQQVIHWHRLHHAIHRVKRTTDRPFRTQIHKIVNTYISLLVMNVTSFKRELFVCSNGVFVEYQVIGVVRFLFLFRGFLASFANRRLV